MGSVAVNLVVYEISQDGDDNHFLVITQIFAKSVTLSATLYIRTPTVRIRS
jgi:hypothetical protein